MASLDVSQEIAADPETVWSIAVDMDSWVDTIEAIEAVERLDDGEGFAPGTTWPETRTMFGKTATEDMEVTEYEEGVRYATFAESHGSKYYSEIRVDPTDGGCRLTMGFRGEAQSTTAKIMDATVGRLFVGSMRKAIAKDLADIGAAAEAAD